MNIVMIVFILKLVLKNLKILGLANKYEYAKEYFWWKQNK